MILVYKTMLILLLDNRYYLMKLVKKNKDGTQISLNTTKKMRVETHLTPWKILIVDDEQDVHIMTELGLKNFKFAQRTLFIFHAMSAYEAKNILQNEADIAVALVDIIMESDDAGLQLINYIRNELKNNLIRIVIRTGQPGQHHERDVVEQYDIYDYKHKSLLNADNLYLTMRMALKNYRDLYSLHEAKQGLERKIYERTLQLEQQNQSLLKLNQEKNEFLSIAAHDLKNPLQAIQGSAEIIELIIKNEDFSGREEVLDFAQMINLNAERMFDLITNLLNVDAIELGKLKIDLQQVDILLELKNIIKSYARKAEIKCISIHFKPEQSTCFICTDVQMLRQILDNLISNAIKYSLLGKNVFIYFCAQQQTVKIEIQDEGYGLSEADQSKLFNKFVRLGAKPTGGEHSTGLGLFIVKKLVTALNGEIYCKSKLGEGATFVLILPMNSDL